MEIPKLSKEFLKRLSAVTAARPKRVIDHILKNGFVTTEELRTLYGYDHPPRAARDVREWGIPLETFRVERKADGRSIGAYRFGDPSEIRRGFIGGRRVFSKSFKAKLLESIGSRCQVCLQTHEERYLQIDHRVPYEVVGDVTFDESDIASYMLLDGSCNRAKSWSCEHCQNWREVRSEKTCKSCYWASPESYSHVAMQNVRRLDLSWSGDETSVYDELEKRSEESSERMPQYVKRVLEEIVRTDSRNPKSKDFSK